MACMFHVVFSIVLLFNVSACQSKTKVENANSIMNEKIIQQEIVDVLIDPDNDLKETLNLLTLQGFTRYNLIFIGNSAHSKMKFYIPEFKSRGFRFYRRGLGLDLNKELDI
ncbi:hypothetical protein ACQCU1_09665 [Sutcliffiella horikoshii]|uniref:Uncharacterized protein n=1 Tax=Sutcliffiella horikoshii TaxID=79883 RepID=A0AA95B8X5_9BACI|nr:hypothetical protein [Sutcliffiella horikoshii]TYS61221.1 hypothetical protein FZC74_02805 [Sutcliffiella horikoshii]